MTLGRSKFSEISKAEVQEAFLTIGLLMLFFTLPACTKVEDSSTGIPDEVGGWRVEVGPSGNEYYIDPSGRISGTGQEFEMERKPPSEAVKRWVEHVIPEKGKTKTDYEYNGKYHRYDVYYGHEKYDFEISRDGDLIAMEYKNPYENVS